MLFRKVIRRGVNMPPSVLRGGVYSLRNRVNGKVYVGSTKTFRHRFSGHRKGLNGGYHPNRHLQSAWDKYGAKSFVFSILERCSEDELLTREQWWMDYLRAYDNLKGYNLRQKAESNLWLKWSEKSRANISLIQIGKKATAETKSRMSCSQTDRWSRIGEKEAQSQRMKGKSTGPNQLKSAAVSSMWSDPMKRAKRIEALKRAWAKRKNHAL